MDILSNLPGPLLHHMMSFLGAREATRLSILSKRWKTLWITLPFLNFDQSEFFCQVSQEYEIDKLKNFVTETLFQHSRVPNLHTFRLSCSFLQNQLFCARIESWVCCVLERNPRVLQISVDSPVQSILLHYISFPAHLLTCPSLENISIHHGTFDPVPRTIHLPALGQLRFSSTLITQDIMTMLLDGCPMLRDLHLEFCSMRFYNLISSSLEHLSVQTRCSRFRVEQEDGIELIDTPKLVSFHYEGCALYMDEEVELNMPSLVGASIYLCNRHRINANEGTFLTGLYKVVNLKLCGSNIEDLLKIIRPQSLRFSNLKYLCLSGICLGCHFHVLATFTQHVPHLTNLKIQHKGCIPQADKHGENQVPMEIAPMRCNYLRVVEVRYSRTDVGFHWVVKYLHEAVAQLNNVWIITASD